MRHYDSTAWKAYVEGNIGELDRNLMEEHMLICDQCMEEYINVIETSGMPEKAPDGFADNVMTALKPEVAAPIRNTIYKSRINSFFRYAAAASIALLLWRSGIFTGLSTGIAKMDESPKRDSIFKTATNTGFGDKIVDGINSMFNSITLKGENLLDEKKK